MAIEHTTTEDGADPTYPVDYTISLYSREGRSDRVTDASHVHDELRRIGLEWKTADWPHRQEVVIMISPIEPTPDSVEKQPFPPEAICPVHGRVNLFVVNANARACALHDHLPGTNGELMTRVGGVIRYVNGAKPVESQETFTPYDALEQVRERAKPYAKKAARALSEFLLK